MDRIIRDGGDGFQRHVFWIAGRPRFVILLEEDGADQPDNGGLVREDTRHPGPALDLAVQALDRIGGVELGPVLGREPLVGEDVDLGVVLGKDGGRSLAC